MKNDQSKLMKLIRDADHSVSYLSSSLHYNNATFTSRLAKFEEDWDVPDDPFLKGIFRFLFEKDSSQLPSVLEFQIRFAIVSQYISQMNIGREKDALETVETALRNKNVRSLRRYAKELNEAIQDPDSYQNENMYPIIIEESIRKLLKEKEKLGFLKVLQPKYDANPYLVFTTKTLHDNILPGAKKRRLWQNIRDPFYFTFCTDPNYRGKGVCCELWLYETKANKKKWKKELEKAGLKCDLETENYLRCFSVRYPPDPEIAEQAFAEDLSSSIPDVEKKVLEAFESLMNQKGKI